MVREGSRVLQGCARALRALHGFYEFKMIDTYLKTAWKTIDGEYTHVPQAVATFQPASDQFAAPSPRAWLSATGSGHAQSVVLSATNVPYYNAYGVEESWTEVVWQPHQGLLHHQALCFRWFHDGRKEWLSLSEDGKTFSCPH